MSEVYNPNEKEIVRCPSCGFVGDLDDFDVLGMDDGILWCNHCNNEITPQRFEPPT